MKEKTSLIKIANIGILNNFQAYQLSDGSLVAINIVDTAGQERYRSLNKSYYNRADGCLLVYDITSKDSFKELEYFLNDINDLWKKNIKIILLGNKTDLGNERQVTQDEGAEFAKKYRFDFMETSCLDSRSVADGFETLIELTYCDKIINKEDKVENNIKLNALNKQACCSC